MDRDALVTSQPSNSLDLSKPDRSPWSCSVSLPHVLDRKQPQALQVKIGKQSGGLASFPTCLAPGPSQLLSHRGGWAGDRLHLAVLWQRPSPVPAS